MSYAQQIEVEEIEVGEIEVDQIDVEPLELVQPMEQLVEPVEQEVEAWVRPVWDQDGWRDLAACRDVESQLFFPVGTTGAALGEIARAKAVCAGCPVAEECLAFAVVTNQEFGVWGGCDEEERRRIRRRWRASVRARA